MKKAMIDETRKLIYNSPLVNYIDINEIEEKLNNVHFYENEEQFNEISKNTLQSYKNDTGIHINPKYENPHVIICELLDDISTNLDPEQASVNRGFKDYLASKISGNFTSESVVGNTFFHAIESSLNDKYDNPNILWDMYFGDDPNGLKNFLNQYVGKDITKNIYENFEQLNPMKIKNIANKINKTIRKERRKKVFQDIVNTIFGRKTNPTLPNGKGKSEKNEDSKLEQYRVPINKYPEINNKNTTELKEKTDNKEKEL